MWIEHWRPGDWLLLSSRHFDGCAWLLGANPNRVAQAEKLHWAVIVNVRQQTYRGRKNKRHTPGEGPVVEVQCPATPIDKKCRFGCGSLARRAHTHHVRASQVLEYRPGVQTVPRIETYLDH